MNPTSPEPPTNPAAQLQPPRLPESSLEAGAEPDLGFLEDDRVPVGGPFSGVDALLRNPRRIMFQLNQEGGRQLIAMLLGVALVCALGYGLIVGMFSGGGQLFFAPVKIAAGLVFSALICLPSLYIFAALGGSRAGLRDVVGLIAGLLALTTVLLVGFAPVAWIFSESTESLAMMGALHLAFWLVSAGFGLRFLRAGFRHTSLKAPQGLSIWTVIFLAVALQMTTALRPILGTADSALPTEKRFFLAHWAENLGDPVR